MFCWTLEKSHSICQQHVPALRAGRLKTPTILLIRPTHNNHGNKVKHTQTHPKIPKRVLCVGKHKRIKGINEGQGPDLSKSFYRELTTIYHQYPLNKKIQSSERTPAPSNPAVDMKSLEEKLANPSLDHGSLLACQGRFREEGRYGGGRYF